MQPHLTWLSAITPTMQHNPSQRAQEYKRTVTPASLGVWALSKTSKSRMRSGGWEQRQIPLARQRAAQRRCAFVPCAASFRTKPATRLLFASCSIARISSLAQMKRTVVGSHAIPRGAAPGGAVMHGTPGSGKFDGRLKRDMGGWRRSAAQAEQHLRRGHLQACKSRVKSTRKC
jgi:hypothetical protein